MKTIKFAQPNISNLELQKVKKTLKTAWIIGGQEEFELEKKLKKKFKKKYCILFNSWTSAAFTLFYMLKKKFKKSEVISPSLSFVASANAPLLAGHKINFCDVDLETYNITLKYIKKNISKNTKIIQTVDQIGNPCDLKSISKYAKKKGIIIVHDAACSLGSKINKKEIGKESDYLLFSFHARKPITSGEGGALLTNDQKIHNLCRIFKSHGMDKNTYDRSKSSPLNFESYLINGLNFKFTDIQASLLNAQIKRLKYFIKKRKIIKNTYDQFFKKYKNIVIYQKNIVGAVSNNQSYMIVLKKNGLRNDLINFLFKKKIETRKAITAIHKEKVFKNKFKKLKLKNSEFIAKNGIQLPIHANLSKKDCKNIIYFIEKYFHLKGLNEQV